LDEFHVDHLQRVLRDFYLEHLVLKMNHHAPANLLDVALNLVRMVVTKVYPNQVVMCDQKNQRNPVEMLADQKTDDHLMDDQTMIRQRMDDQKTDVPDYLDDQNFRDALPCVYSLISIEN
jgi:hypothetical protein